MAKDSPTGDASRDDVLEVDLKDPRLAALLAWLLPGLGHIYQGRFGKGVLFFVCIVGTFVFGLYIGGGKVVYAYGINPLSRQFYQRWPYLCQVCVGLPALPALVQAAREQGGRTPLFGYEDTFMRPPRREAPLGERFTSGSGQNVVTHPDEEAKWQYDLAGRFEMGTIYTIIAGLLNILAIYDAYAGPLVIPPREDQKKRGAEKQKSK